MTHAVREARVPRWSGLPGREISAVIIWRWLESLRICSRRGRKPLSYGGCNPPTSRAYVDGLHPPYNRQTRLLRPTRIRSGHGTHWHSMATFREVSVATVADPGPAPGRPACPVQGRGVWSDRLISHPEEDRADSEAVSTDRGLTSDDFAHHPLLMRMPPHGQFVNAPTAASSCFPVVTLIERTR